jgi:hypothetical protein
MKTFQLSAAIVLLVSGLSATGAFAATGQDLHSFFQNIEGHWTGKGSIQELQGDGSRKMTGFKMELQVERSSDEGRWDSTSQFELDTEVTSQDQVSYALRGDDLFVSANSQVEPVLVLDASPLKLSYFMRRAEVLTGRVFDFTFTYTVNSPQAGGATQELTSHNVVEVNGVVVSDETSQARRW